MIKIESLFRLAEIEASKSECPRTKVGCVLVKNNKILLAAHNKELSRLSHCKQFGCIRNKYNVESGTCFNNCYGIHAEQSLIIQCALKGISPIGGELYITHIPCTTCAKLLIESGIKRISYIHNYPHTEAKRLFEEVGVICEQWKMETANVK